MHQDLHGASPKLGFTFESVCRCSGTPERYEVGLWQGDDVLIYFLVQGSGTFTMKEISDTPHTGCVGKNLLYTPEAK